MVVQGWCHIREQFLSQFCLKLAGMLLGVSYHRKFMLPLVLAHKSLIFHSRFEEELEVRSSH